MNWHEAIAAAIKDSKESDSGEKNFVYAFRRYNRGPIEYYFMESFYAESLHRDSFSDIDKRGGW